MAVSARANGMVIAPMPVQSPCAVIETEVDFSGVTLVHQAGEPAMSFFGVMGNLSWRGGAIEYEKPNFSQGTVLGKLGLTFTFQLHDGYTEAFSKVWDEPLVALIVYSPKTRLMKESVSIDLYVDTATILPISGNVFEASLSTYQEAAFLSIGDLVAWKFCTGSHAISVQQSQNLNLSDWTISGSPCMGVVDTGGLSLPNSYENIVITRSPIEIGEDRQLPLLSTNADCFHHKMGRAGPIINNCTFWFCGDDIINIHGIYMLLSGSNAETQDISLEVLLDFPPVLGDTLYAYNLETGFLGSSQIVRLLEPDGPVMVTDSPSDLFPAMDRQLYSSALYGISPWLEGLDANSFVMNVNQSGTNYRILNSRFGFNRARGLMLQGFSGVAEYNMINRTGMAGIALFPNMHWGESGVAENVAIRENILDRTGLFKLMENVAAIKVTGMSPGSPLVEFAYQNITIVNNTFVSIPDGVSILDWGNVYGLFVQKNVFVNNKCALHSSDFAQNSFIQTSTAFNVEMTENKITCS